MLFQQIAQNKRRTFFLVILFSVLVLALGWAIGYLVNNDSVSGVLITLVILVFYVPITYMTASSQVLRMSGAQEVTEAEEPELYHIVEELALAARLPMPKVYLIQDPSPNAFATGIKPEKAAVAFTTGLVSKLNREELEGVVAHELGHIRNYDIRLMTVCIALVGVITLIAEFGSRMLFFGGGRRNNDRNGRANPILLILALVFVIVAPIAGQFVRLAVSRNREYLADATAVEFTRNPQGLIHALEKISADPHDVQEATNTTAAMYISPPLRKNRRSRASLWATHPSTADRIARLEAM